jgi:hypothetical protein
MIDCFLVHRAMENEQANISHPGCGTPGKSNKGHSPSVASDRIAFTAVY